MKLKKILEDRTITAEEPVELNINLKEKVTVYPKSIHEYRDLMFFIARNGLDKYLFVAAKSSNDDFFIGFEGNIIENADTATGYIIKKCPLNHMNALSIRELFEFTRPKIIGLQNSFGFGDRLGLANAGHLQSLTTATNPYVPVLAQQSIRELERTHRTPEEVMDAAVWAAFQEGYHGGFGADADHLKTTHDIDIMLKAGFTMFTFDPSDHVINDADTMNEEELSNKISHLPWNDFQTDVNTLLNRYEKKTFRISQELVLNPSKLEIMRALLKYGDALIHIKKLFEHLKKSSSDKKYEVECSVDETKSVTTPFDHFFFVYELKRLEVDFVSLAPRFVGDFEKGIDFKGDLDVFRTEYRKHQQIAAYFGNYKLSLHSGSDKFSVYKIMGQVTQGCYHVKTAGTSYLEALKVIAVKSPQLFRDIFQFSLDNYEAEKRSYHVSAQPEKLKPAADCSDEQLVSLFDNNHARQVLHVSFGKVLTDKNDKGTYIFRDKIYHCLIENEQTYDQYLEEHFRRHLDAFRI